MRSAGLVTTIFAMFFAAMSTSAPAHAVSTSVSHRAAVSPQAATCTATNCPSWGYWQCQTGSNGTFKYWCKTWVRYDECGGSRAITVNQYTKMAGQFRFSHTPPVGNPQAYNTVPWGSRGSSGAVTRSYTLGETSAGIAVWTTVKPDNKPYISCTL